MLDAWGDHPAVAETLREASSALDEDLGELIRTGPKEALALTTNTQPVMLVAGVAAWRAWLAEGGATPDVVAGHSLGEYSALVAAGVLTLAQAAPLACAGVLMAGELDALGKALKAPAHPMVAIVAGSKVSTKLTILESLADKVDQLIVGGGIANTFLLAEGKPIGKSLAEHDLVDEAKKIMAKMAAKGGVVPLPTDVVVASEFAADAKATVKSVDDVAADDMILDIGPQSAAALAGLLKAAGTIVWNGPVGVFEFDQFAGGTEALAKAIAQSKAFSIAGGGDTLAAIAKFGITDQISYISTGGGAFLEFLEGKELPAVAVLEKRA